MMSSNTAQLGELSTPTLSEKKPHSYSLGGQVCLLVGGISYGLSPLLPWATLGALSADGFTKLAELAFVLVVLGTLTMLAAVVALSRRRNFTKFIPTILMILSALVIGFFTYVLRVELPRAASLGVGVNFGILGAVLIFVACALIVSSKPENRES